MAIVAFIIHALLSSVTWGLAVDAVHERDALLPKKCERVHTFVTVLTRFTASPALAGVEVTSSAQQPIESIESAKGIETSNGNGP